MSKYKKPERTWVGKNECDPHDDRRGTFNNAAAVVTFATYLTANGGNPAAVTEGYEPSVIVFSAAA